MDPPGASDSLNDAPSIFENRRSYRATKPSWLLKRDLAPDGADTAARPANKPGKPRKATKPRPPPTQVLLPIPASESQPSLTSKPELEPSRSQNSSITVKEEVETARSVWDRGFAECKGDKSKIKQFLLQQFPGESYSERLFVSERPSEVVIDELGKAEDSSPANPLPLFYEFIPFEIMQSIAQNTNKQARNGLDVNDAVTPRKWDPISKYDVAKTIGALYMIGATRQPGEIIEHWDLLPEHSTHQWTKHIAVSRFSQIIRYFKINDPDEKWTRGDWWKKLDPLVTHWRKTASRLVRLGSDICVDEQLIKFFGRSPDITNITSKAAGKGYKIYTLATRDGYVADFLFYSVKQGVSELDDFKPTAEYWAKHTNKQKRDFSNSERIVLTLIDRMRKRHPGEQIYTVALDNFFTTHKLLSELKQWKIAAFGTAKAGAGIPKELLLLKDYTSKEQDYGLETNTVFEGVNCVFLVDMKGLGMMTTLHDVKNDRCQWRPAVKRPNASHARAKIDEETGDVVLKYIRISKEYNKAMGGVDIAQQLQNVYTTACHRHNRTWWPLFFNILDATVANMMRIFQMRGQWTNKHSHKELQITIATQLLESPSSLLRKRKTSLQIWGQRPTKIPKVPGEHEKITFGKKRGHCEMCKPHCKRGRPRKILGDITNTAPTPEATVRYRGTWTVYACRQCTIREGVKKLWLCVPGCWNSWHSIEGHQ